MFETDLRPCHNTSSGQPKGEADVGEDENKVNVTKSPL